MSYIVTVDTIHAAIKAHVEASGMRVSTIAVLSGIPDQSLRRKLALPFCHFTVDELASLARCLDIRMQAFFEPVPSVEHHELHRNTEPGSPDLDGIGGGL